MKNPWKLIFALLIASVPSLRATAQTKVPQETRNAALRYWMAFARLQDVSVDAKTKGLLEQALTDPSAWDDTKLGPVIDENLEAIETMQRATKLPECDWGLEYSRGLKMQLQIDGHAARALARLNILYGMRSVAKGDSQKAADAWIAGIRFSQDIARGGSLLATLVGESVLLQDLRVIAQATVKGTFNADQKRQLVSAVKALPETGFDWSTAVFYEGYALNLFAVEMRSDPAGWYQKLMDRPAPAGFAAPTDAEIAQYKKFIAAVQMSFRKPAPQTALEVKKLQDEVATQHILFREGTPSLQKINDTRAELESVRQTALKALAAQP